MKKMIYLFIYMVFICSFTGCSTVGVTLEAAEEQTETEISVVQESSAETFGKQDAETENGKEREAEEVLMTIICKRQNTDMPEYVFPETVELAEFEELSYRLFVSWNMIHVDGGEVYWDYGILDKENNTWKKAVERYSQEMEKVLGYPEEMIWENTDEASGRRVNRDTKERITDISPNGQYYITHSGGIYWEPDGQVIGIEPEMKLYHGNQCISQMGDEEILYGYMTSRQLDRPFGIWTGDEMIYNIYDGTKEPYNDYGCLNQDATLAAKARYWDREGIIYLYDVKSQQCLYSFEQLYSSEDENYYMHIYQLVGNKDSGFILFWDPTGVYKLHYPSGEVELIGHYMFNPSLSPDGKYLFYTGPDDDFWTSYGWGSDNEEYNKIPVGMYIKELQTGKTACIGMDEELRYSTVAVRWLEASDE